MTGEEANKPPGKESAADIRGGAAPKPASQPITPPGPSPRATGKFQPIGSGTGKYTPIGGRRASDVKSNVPASTPPAARPGSKFAPVPTPPFMPASGTSAGAARPATTQNRPLPISRAPSASGVNPFGNLSVAAPGKSQSPGASGTANAAGGATKAGSWSCSKCAKVLGPRSVNQGTAIFLEGNLICVECVKGARRNQAEIPVATLALVAGATVAVLGGVGYFLPSQALLAGLLLGVGMLMVGAIGFTLDGRARLATLALGLLVIALTAFGLISVGQHKEDKAAFNEIAAQSDEVKALLVKECLPEAEARISSIETQMNRKYANQPAPQIVAAIADLRAQTRKWQEDHFGKLETTEQKLLSELYHRVGSLTPYTQTPRIKDYKIDQGKYLSIVVATDVTAPAYANTSDDGTNVNKETDDPIGAEATRVAMLAIKQDKALETVQVKIVAGGPNGKELLSRTYDSARVSEIRETLKPPAHTQTADTRAPVRPGR